MNSKCHSIDELLALPRTIFNRLRMDLFGVPVRTSHILGHGFFRSSTISKNNKTKWNLNSCSSTDPIPTQCHFQSNVAQTLSSNRVNRNFPPFVKSSAIKPQPMCHPSLIESRPVNCSEKTMETSRWTREIPSFHQLHPVSGGDNGKSTVDPFSQSSHGVTFTIFARLPRKTSSSFSWPMFSLLGSDD